MKKKRLGFYGTKSVGSIIKIFPLSEDGLRESVYLESRLFCRLRNGCQDVKLLSLLRTKIASEISLPSCPLHFCSSDCYPHLPSVISERVNYRHPELVSGSYQMLKHRGQSAVQHDINSLKRTYSPINLFSYSLFKKCAFTLAEVLITLGIIGVVAAMTMPALIQNHRNSVVEARLKKFYSTMNQAVMLSEVDNGDKREWYQDLAGAQIDDEGNPIAGSSEFEKWFNKYLMPYLNDIKSETLSNGTFIVYFADGSALATVSSGWSRDWYFYPSNAAKCMKKTREQANGICRFSFAFNPCTGQSAWKYHEDKGFEPTKYLWDGTEELLYSGCEGTVGNSVPHSMCTALIQYNGWKIPKDYPKKISY